ncbi:lysophospholipid acyltransferase family protein [Balneola vulgaris]|uniref:lysophospholipid acyltransferase family protein n=1 Tax=Balneola vulgaris TaxID=287535 RepID=UPI0003796032|nr:lysophospholipid acyltransferase family protein [Balneola vulgaris]
MRKNFLWYHAIRYGVAGTGLKLFYKKIRIDNKKKVYKDKPLLLVPNHQNSFMDAMLITTNLHRSTSFLTRAKAFNTPFMNWFLRSLNMLPVYRVRDGMSSIQKNNAIFQRCVDLLSDNECVLIFAEANHDLRRRLRPLSKGFTRIAFDAEIQNNWELDLYIQPVGVNYSDHQLSRNEVRVVYGDPIRVADFKDIYEEDERKAANALKNAVAENLKPIIMHVQKLDQYPLAKVALDELEPVRKKVADPEYMNALVAKVEADHTPELIQTAEEILETASEYDLNIRRIADVKKPRWKQILLAPLYFLVWINNVIPYQPVRSVVRDKIKDKAFDASIKFVLGLTLFPLFYLFVTIILLIAGVPFWYTLGYLAFSLATSTMFKSGNEVLRDFKQNKKIKEFSSKHPEVYNTLVKKIKTIQNYRERLVSSE